MRKNFEPYVKFMIWQLEGGDKVHTVKGDPGGTTKYGISKAAHPKLDIPSLTEPEATQLYLDEYWTPNGCDALPWPQDVLVFDTAVNQSRFFARQIGTWDWRDIMLARLERYCTKSNPIFIHGLANRLLKIRRWICQ